MCKSSLHRECLHCGTDISDMRPSAKFCSRACKSNSHKRRKKYETKYGITRDQRDHMYAEQDAKCKVCDEHMTLESLKANSAHVDHCHTTGEVHGLLCARCNKAAGLLGENPEITAKLTAYLLDTGKVPTR